MNAEEGPLGETATGKQFRVSVSRRVQTPAEDQGHPNQDSSSLVKREAHRGVSGEYRVHLIGVRDAA